MSASPGKQWHPEGTPLLQASPFAIPLQHLQVIREGDRAPICLQAMGQRGLGNLAQQGVVQVAGWALVCPTGLLHAKCLGWGAHAWNGACPWHGAPRGCKGHSGMGHFGQAVRRGTSGAALVALTAPCPDQLIVHSRQVTYLQHSRLTNVASTRCCQMGR